LSREAIWIGDNPLALIASIFSASSFSLELVNWSHSFPIALDMCTSPNCLNFDLSQSGNLERSHYHEALAIQSSNDSEGNSPFGVLEDRRMAALVLSSGISRQDLGELWPLRQPSLPPPTPCSCVPVPFESVLPDTTHMILARSRKSRCDTGPDSDSTDPQ
jgi:hypothetical protein